MTLSSDNRSFLYESNKMTTMRRIPLPEPETMSDAQRAVYDNIVRGPRGRVIGPLRAVLHNPELADRWQRLGEILRYSTSLPPKLNELAIVVTARRWNSQIEWHVHSEAARQAGLSDDILDALKAGETLIFSDEAEFITYEFARQLQEHGTVNDAIYTRAVELWQAVGVVDLTSVIGYYTMVSMTLNAHDIPMPDGLPNPLTAPLRDGLPILSTLPNASLRSQHT